MDFLTLAKSRYSSRKYTSQEVEKEKLDYILECGRVAPSAANFQPWHFIVVTDQALVTELAQAYPREWFQTAPVAIVICGDHLTSWKRADGKDHCDVDISIATDHMTLAATDVGLATCWICNFDAGKCTQILHLPDHIEPIAILSLGYPGDAPGLTRHDQKRKPAGHIIHWNTFSPSL